MINQTSLSRPRGRPPAFERAAVLALAARTFWHLGYEGASIADLTAAMGITAQSLYAAFGSKAALYREALEHYQVTAGAFGARALMEEAGTPAAFARLLRDAAREYSRSDQPRGCMILTAVPACAVENDVVAAHVAAVRAEILAGFTARLGQGIARGELKPDTDAAGLARYIQAVLQGMSLQARDGAGEAELAAIAETAITEIETHRRRSQRGIA